MVNRARCASIVLVILGLGFIIASVLLFILGDSFIDNAVKKGCQLRDGTPAYDNWRKPAVPLHISFYVYDLNGTDFLTNNNSKPAVIQRGPFVYKEIRTKTDVETYDNGTISYHEYRNYTFDRQASCSECDETMNITTFNIVYMTLVNFLQTEHAARIIRDIIGKVLAPIEQPTMKLSVKELLWGYEDPILKFLKQELPEFISDDRVSVYYASVSQAGSNIFLINSGVDLHPNENRIKRVGNIELFNYEEKLPYWSNDNANRINGTDSTIWHPDATPQDDVYIFTPDLCRSLHLEFQDTRKNDFGIENHRFVLPPKTFSHDNQGFCLNSTNDPNLICLPNGLMSLKTCVKLSGSSVSIPLPIIASFPHFLDADPIVQNAVRGLRPDPAIHRSFMDIEPTTGTVMNGSRRMQVNLNVVNDSEIIAISHLQPFVYPMIWLDEHAEIDKPNSDKFRSKVVVPMTVVEAMKYVTLAVGGILFIIVVILIVRSHHQTKETGDAFPPVAPDESAPLLW